MRVPWRQSGPLQPVAHTHTSYTQVPWPEQKSAADSEPGARTPSRQDWLLAQGVQSVQPTNATDPAVLFSERRRDAQKPDGRVNAPEEHAWHVLEPRVGARCSVEHDAHVTEPGGPTAIVPVSHGAHCPPGTPKCPLLHATHADALFAPAASVVKPNGHAWHVSALLLPLAVLYVPCGHSSHVLAPPSGWKVPGRQLLQEDAPPADTRPGRHATHCKALVAPLPPNAGVQPRGERCAGVEAGSAHAPVPAGQLLHNTVPVSSA